MPLKCPLCFKKEFNKNNFNVENREFSLCRNCGLIQVEKEYLVSSRVEKERYILHDNSITNKDYINYLENIIKTLIKPYIKKNSRILDFGSGPESVLSKLLKRDGYKYINIYDKYFTDDISVLKKEYDGIILIEVIEHIINIRDTLKQLFNILKNNGSIIIKTLFHDNINFETWWYARDITHVTFLSRKTAEFISDTFGLNLIKISQSAVILKKPQ
jgi:hypothetical protein